MQVGIARLEVNAEPAPSDPEDSSKADASAAAIRRSSTASYASASLEATLATTARTTAIDSGSAGSPRVHRCVEVIHSFLPILVARRHGVPSVPIVTIEEFSVEPSFETHTHGTWTVVNVRGELDLSTSAELRAALDAGLGEGAPRIAVDLSEVSFMDSSSLGVLVSCLREGAQARRRCGWWACRARRPR